jgi:serine/threonine-protein kinase RsbW
VQINMRLNLPTDEASIPAVRHICAQALTEIGAAADCVHDIEVALTEACANVVEHSGGETDYSVEVTIDDARCVIRVYDDGPGFESADVAAADPSSEGGRGVNLMRALVDRVRFESKPEDGTIVSLEKELRFERSTLVAAATGDEAH